MTFSGMDAAEVVRVVGWLEERSVVYQVNGGLTGITVSAFNPAHPLTGFGQ